MDIEKLIDTLKQHGVSCVRSYGKYCSICDEAATALSTLQAENERLRAELEQVKQCVDGKPAADVAPVRHGRWIVFDSENPESKECTACGYLFSRIHPSNYCPYCGALMDGKED